MVVAIRFLRQVCFLPTCENVFERALAICIRSHREKFTDISERLHWPGTQTQSPAGSDDEGSMTASENAYELALRECVADKM